MAFPKAGSVELERSTDTCPSYGSMPKADRQSYPVPDLAGWSQQGLKFFAGHLEVTMNNGKQDIELDFNRAMGCRTHVFLHLKLTFASTC